MIAPYGDPRGRALRVALPPPGPRQSPAAPRPPPGPASPKQKKTKKPKRGNTEYFALDEEDPDVPMLTPIETVSRFSAVTGDVVIQDTDLRPLGIPSTRGSRPANPAMQVPLVQGQAGASFLQEYPPI
jgi:hypothetical protein